MTYLQHHVFQCRLLRVLRVASLMSKALAAQSSALHIQIYSLKDRSEMLMEIRSCLWLHRDTLSVLGFWFENHFTLVKLTLVCRGNEFYFSGSVIVELGAWFPKKARLVPSPVQVFGSPTFLLPFPVHSGPPIKKKNHWLASEHFEKGGSVFLKIGVSCTLAARA